MVPRTSIPRKYAKLTSQVPDYLKKLLDASVTAKGAWRPGLRLIGKDVPSVDIAIVCCNEDLAVILDTVKAALNTDWPSDRMRIIVSDDGAQKSVESGVQRLQEQYPNNHLFYTARQRTRANSHKAGNLNHVLEYTTRLPGGQASFIAGLDADMIPQRDWLRAQLPHLLMDPKMAFTCPPPCFYNVPIDDPLSQSLFAFHRFEEILKDAAGIAWCTGSGWVMRRAALAEINGFPTQSLTEDLLCGNLLLGKGEQIYTSESPYVQEELQWGLVPDSYSAHIRQRTRWSTGGVQAGLIMKIGLYGDLSRGLTGWQRGYTSWYLFQNASATLKTLDVAKTVIMLFAGWPVVIYAREEQLIALARVASAAHVLFFVRQCLMAYVNGYGASCREILCLYFMNTYLSLNHWRTFVLPQWLGGHPTAFFAKFQSTGSLPDELHERNRLRRAPLRKRLRSILIDAGGIFHLCLALAIVAGFSKSIKAASNLHAPASRSFFLYLLPRALWVASTWPAYAVAFFRPAYYAVCPPTMPERELLLERNAEGVAYPKDSAKLPKSPMRGLGIESINTLTGIWAIIVCVWSWSLPNDTIVDNLLPGVV
ncbi:nucleotide-diphospho-sugar transferase [Paraphoma chrysanthemicola]|uniref:Nucleotide-diphospho-sugar transferase n=1 Tax=Paraphoma chrysanthemicola TaxID=798071 RepID=A0A8K0QX57_9PLEO|nr:nucleotide-diphospho-sugar transferase [Paraphoma chrysanthemicola]